RNSLLAVFAACIAMLIYIAIRFELNYGIAAILSLLHDVLFTISVFAVFNIPVNTPFIAAILTIVGYSINDTIVVFDRIRENRNKNRREPLAEVANRSINQTLRRSINTSVTTLITIVALNLLVPTVREFTFPLILGIGVGTYSSIFIASPILVILNKKRSNKNKAELA
uniref:protein translocase subunit SecF n=1 Tax=Clostridium sp. TaxID=1506 RepID=UPI002630D3C4